MPLAAGLAISRDLLDTALVEAAIDAGAAFLPQTQASLGAETALARTVGLRTGSSSRDITASVVLAADGLGGSLVARLPGCKPQVQEHSWIGAGTTTPDGPAPYSPGTIFMGCGRRGYVGLVRVEAGRLNIAAAIDPVGVRQAGGLGLAASLILKDAGLPDVPNLEGLAWRGTPALTRQASRVAFHRLFVLGDAAGYVEPFTGEGIGCALATAQATAPLVMRGIVDWHSSLEMEWCATYEQTVRRRQRVCVALTSALRHQFFARVMVTALARAPALARVFARHLNH